jgi:hypothetical protein
MTELISDDYILDLKENVAVPVNFAIADVKDPSKRKRNFSKEIELPDTINNRAFFSGVFSLNVTDDGINFDATAKTNAILKKNGVPILPDAVIRLNSVIRRDKDLVFKVTLFSESVDIFLLLSNIRVNELDWSAYDHTLSQANIVTSWTAGVGSGYYYPLIERGTDRPTTTTWRTTDLLPYVYLKEALEKTLEFAGVSYSSTFLSSTRFENVLFGYGGGDIPTISATDIAQREVEVNTGDYTHTETLIPVEVSLPTTTDIGLVGNFTPSFFNSGNTTYTEVTDGLDQFDDAKIYVQRTGNYLLEVSGGIDWSYSIGSMTFLSAGCPFLEIRRNGVVIGQMTQAGDFTGQSGTTTYSYSSNLYLESGDTISFNVSPRKCFTSVTDIADKESITYDITTSTNFTWDLDCIDTEVTDGGTIVLSQFVPNMKCSDLLLGCIRQFNLYMGDPDIYNEVEIEPLIDFYGATTDFDDISLDIDYDKDFTIKPTANDYAKNILFKFKKMEENDARFYFDKYGVEYGDKDYEQGSYYAKGELKIELPWSTIVPFEIDTGILVPRFIEFDSNNNAKPKKGAPRIAMNNGLKTGSWTFTDGDGGNPSAKATYPCMHHFDDWEDPDYDLNFQLVQEVLYTADIVTTVNSYSEYYSTFIEEMTNKAGKLIECYVKWDANDVYNRDFGKLLMINGALFRLNVIQDFDPDVSSSTKIELIKVIDADSPRSRKITFTNSTNPPDPNASLRKTPYKIVSAGYSIDPATDEIIEVDTSGVRVSLREAPTNIVGQHFEVINSSNGVIDVRFTPYTANGEDIIELQPEEVLQVVSNGTEYKII